MRKLKFEKLMILLLAVLLAFTACTTETQPQESEKTPAPSTPVVEQTVAPESTSGLEEPTNDEPQTGEEYIAGLYEAMAERAEQYAPKVTTLANGVQVQRTPTEFYAGVYHNPGETISYNTYYLKADNRGCTACHQDLAELLSNMEYDHVDLRNTMGIEATLAQCIDCHSYSPGYLTEFYGFGSLIHGIHFDNAAFTGECMSCHNATNDGTGMQLWDLTKHSLLRGIIDVPDVQGEFTFTQDKLTSNEDLFSFNWMYYAQDYERYGKEKAGEPLDEEVFDNWVISVSGAVEEPYEIKLVDLIKEAPVETTTMKMHCTINPMGGPLLGNCEITGIPLDYVLEKAKIKDTATFIYPYSDDGFTIPTALSLAEANGAYLVYEIDGKPLRHILGYPLQIWIGGAAASSCVKQVSQLVITDEPIDSVWQYSGWVREDEGYYNKPNIGICNLAEGQIIEAGKPHTFEGYADGFNLPITAVEISMDRGATWTSYSTQPSDVSRLIAWDFTFTPDQPGAYVIMARALASDGSTSDEPVEIMVNAK